MTAGAGRLARAASLVACSRCGGTGIEPTDPVDGESPDRTAVQRLIAELDRIAASQAALSAFDFSVPATGYATSSQSVEPGRVRVFVPVEQSDAG